MSNVQEILSSTFWDEQYKVKAAWDLNSPNPVFTYLIKNKIINPSKLIILGSGKGFDAVLASESGFEVTAVDFSEEAINYSIELSRKFNAKVNFINSDMFEIDSNLNNTFDLLYEYVTYCAIEPSKRNQFIDLVKRLLKPGGRFITVLFPIDGRGGGPPFSVNQEEFIRNLSADFKLELMIKNIPSVKPRKGKEILLIFRKTE